MAVTLWLSGQGALVSAEIGRHAITDLQRPCRVGLGCVQRLLQNRVSRERLKIPFITGQTVNGGAHVMVCG
jgi:hypothetical protein